MARLRVRDMSNGIWIDICQSEWYVRAPNNLSWIRLFPNGQIAFRHEGCCWESIDCFLEETCPPVPGAVVPPDAYGGTPDGSGVGVDGTGAGGHGWSPINEEFVRTPREIYIDNQWTPSGPNWTVLPNIRGPGRNGEVWSGGREMDGFDGNTSDGGSGFGDEFTGDNQGGGTGADGGNNLVERENGDLCLQNADGTCDPYEGGGGDTSSSGGEGTSSSPGVCPESVHSMDNIIVMDRYIDVSDVNGNVRLEYVVTDGEAKIDIFYEGQLKAQTSGFVSGSGSLNFVINTGEGGGGVIGVRATKASLSSNWLYAIRCSNTPEVTDDTEGTLTSPAACHGTYQPIGGGGAGIEEVYHEMGGTAGEVLVEYQMWYVADTMEIWHGGRKIGGTGGPISGEGSITFYYQPAGNDTMITIRMISSSTDTSWAYLITCPGDPSGSSLHPKLCEIDPSNPISSTYSGGAGTTDTYYDLSSDDGGGMVKILYQMWYVEDTMQVYQNGQLVASTGGPVAGEGELTFQYNPANGSTVQIRVVGSGSTSWAFVVACAYEAPDLTVDNIRGDEGTVACFTVSLLNNEVSNRDIDITYHFEDVTTLMSDYQDKSSTAGTARIPAGTNSIQICVDVLVDAELSEPEETVKLIIDSATNADIDTNQGILTIEPNLVNINCGQPFTGSGATTINVAYTGVDKGFVLIEYTTVATGIAVGAGIPNRVQTSIGGVVVEDTLTAQYRYEDHGYGTLAIPVAAGQTELELKNPDSDSYWRQTAHCPIVWPGDFSFRAFSYGLPAAEEINAFNTDNLGFTSAAKRIGVAGSGGSANAKSMIVAMTMFRTTGGAVRLSCMAEGLATVRIWPSSGPMIMPSVPDFSGALANIDVPLAANTTFFLAVYISNPSSLPAPTNLVMAVRDNADVLAVTSQDWKMDYMEQRSYGAGNEAIFSTSEAKIFSSQTQINEYMSHNAAPRMVDIFNSWPRATLPDLWYSNGATASGEAAAWYFDEAADTFVQPLNTVYGNFIYSPQSYESYTLEATLTSTNRDDDAIGLVVATVNVGGVAHALTVVRTHGGLPPYKGFGLIVNEGRTLTVLIDEPVGLVRKNPDIGWNGARSRVYVNRSGNIVNIKCSNWDTTAYAAEFTVDLDSLGILDKFKGPHPFGFFTRSQSDSKYLDVNMPNPEGKIFNAETGEMWEGVNGVWTNKGSSLSLGERLGWPSIVTNPITNAQYYVFNKTSRLK